MADNDTSIGLYSDRVHVVWTAFLVLTSQLFSTSSVQNSLEMWCPHTQLSMVNSMQAIALACPATGLLYTWKLWLCNNDDITLWSFGIWNIGGLLSKPPILQKGPCQNYHTVANCLRPHGHCCSLQCCGSLEYLYNHLPILCVCLHFAMTSLCGTVVQFLIWNRRGDPDTSRSFCNWEWVRSNTSSFWGHKIVRVQSAGGEASLPNTQASPPKVFPIVI